MKLLYLATPYSHPDPAVRSLRFRQACHAATALIRSGEVVFAPIVHGHPLVEYGLAGDWSFWGPVDAEFLRRCDEVMVLMIEGWEESEGVRHETRIAAELGKPVHYLAPPAADGSPTLAHVATSRQLGQTPAAMSHDPNVGAVGARIGHPA